ncbi:putative ATP-grasp-modified RiPP [Streptomyces melanogenes]|uniref:ATP-grasp-modified RiPP n=1 Tax=Streptomyces melanogenes TaxID=67326 RepID=A0ABZ1XVE5_9ACTN|nr:putative ATP-grasp-modified RiPP [Streptomyces melanogenes]
MRPFTLRYTVPHEPEAVAVPYRFDASRQLNVLPDGRPAVADRAVLRETGTTASTAGSQTHFDD